MSNILVTRSSMPSFEEYCEEIKDIWNSHWLTNMGVKHKELQKQLEEYLNIPHVALYTNGWFLDCVILIKMIIEVFMGSCKTSRNKTKSIIC